MALELKLKSTSQYDDRFKYTKIASQEEIERNESFGLTHIAIDGVSHFVNVNDESAMQELKIRLNLPYCEWFHETTGNKNWVLYDPKHYVVDKNWEGNNILKLHTWAYDGSPIGLPVNASSLCGLFSWMQVPNNIQFGRNFTLRGIVDTSLMFTGCILPSDFRFDERFNTKDVKNMRYMFYKCKLPVGFDLGEYFYTDACENMEYMFSRSLLPINFNLGPNFTLQKVKTLHRMFYEASIYGDVDLGKKFIIPNDDVNIEEMMDRITINGEMKSIKPKSNVLLSFNV